MSQGLATASIIHGTIDDKGCVLVISDSGEAITEIDNTLSPQGFDILLVSEGERVLNLLAKRHIDFVVIDLDSVDMAVDELVHLIRVRVDDNFTPILILTSDDEKLLTNCLSAGCDDFLYKPFTSAALKAKLFSLNKMRELKQLYKSSIDEQIVAKKILAYAISERNVQFEEIKVLSKSKAVFSGDLFLTAKCPDGGLHILLADFTGHGLSAAIGTLSVADIFSVMTEKGFELEVILENINNKLHTLLPVSMFMACITIKINSDLKQVEVWNGGMPDIYVRDGNTGEIKNKISAEHIPLAISDSSQSDFTLSTITLNPDDQFIIYSDGLTEAVNANGDMFGYEHFEQCFKNNQSQKSIFSYIVDAFNSHCGNIDPDDDVTFACIPCSSELTEVQDDNEQI